MLGHIFEFRKFLRKYFCFAAFSYPVILPGTFFVLQRPLFRTKKSISWTVSSPPSTRNTWSRWRTIARRSQTSLASCRWGRKGQGPVLNGGGAVVCRRRRRIGLDVTEPLVWRRNQNFYVVASCLILSESLRNMTSQRYHIPSFWITLSKHFAGLIAKTSSDIVFSAN